MHICPYIYTNWYIHIYTHIFAYKYSYTYKYPQRSLDSLDIRKKSAHYAYIYTLLMYQCI